MLRDLEATGMAAQHSGEQAMSLVSWLSKMLAHCTVRVNIWPCSLCLNERLNLDQVALRHFDTALT